MICHNARRLHIIPRQLQFIRKQLFGYILLFNGFVMAVLLSSESKMEVYGQVYVPALRLPYVSISFPLIFKAN